MTVTAPAASAAPITDLAAAVRGRLVLPHHADWAAARLPWLVNVDQQPAAVLEVADADDVVAAVRWAVRHGWSVSAQPRGHAARTTLDGTLLLRTRALDELQVDPARRVARVGAGVKMGELLAALDGTGLVALSGSNPDPSVIGLLLGGGVSWFTRKHGFTANSVLAFDVVDPSGTLRRVDAVTDPDLFWALRGGGGDFAVVVAAELRLFAEPQLYGGRLLWAVDHAGAVLRAFRDLAAVAPRELTMWAHVYHFPPMPELPETFRGRSFVSVASTFLGEDQEAERLLAVLRDAAPVELDLMGALPVSALGTVADEPTEPMPVLDHTVLLEELDDPTIDRLVAAVADPARCPLLIVQLRHLGGAFAERPAGGGAVDPVDAGFNLWACGVPAVPELVAAISAAFGGLDLAVADVAVGRRLPNFAGDGQADAAGYDAATLSRLRAIKSARDPHGTIRSNKPVLA